MRTRDLAVCYIGDGYLAAAMPLNEYFDGTDFCEEREEECEIAFLRNVPEGLANDLEQQGCSSQVFGDGYEAAQAAIPYLDHD